MRPVALGRKNWMHLGSQESGPPVAAIMTVLASAQRAGLNVRAYLADCLDALADRHFTTSPPANFRPCCPSPGKRASPEPAPPQSPFPRVAAPLHRWWRPPPPSTPLSCQPSSPSSAHDCAPHAFPIDAVAEGLANHPLHHHQHHTLLFRPHDQSFRTIVSTSRSLIAI